MSNIYKGLCWAAALLLVALARRHAVLDAETADTLLLVVPIVALLSLRGGCECRATRRKEA